MEQAKGNTSVSSLVYSTIFKMEAKYSSDPEDL
jgi:hypothetical protein